MNDALWVFGYGSLIWQPGFDFVAKEQAMLRGYARSFCMRSIHHRGTVDHNGLVLALDRVDDAHCHGIAFQVADKMAAQTLDYLRERELVSSAYLEKTLPVTLNDGREISAVTYVIDADHDQYCQLDLETQAQMIATAVGGRGPNTDYLYNTVDSIKALNLVDPELSWLDKRVRELTG